MHQRTTRTRRQPSRRAHVHTRRGTRRVVVRRTPFAPAHHEETHVYHHTTPATARRRVVERHVYHTPAPRRRVVRRNTTVHHNHSNSGGATVNSRVQDSTVSESSVTTYLTAGMGISGFASPQMTDLPLPGGDFNMGLGARSGWLSTELGLTMGGYRFDSNQSASDITMLGVTADVKLQPTLLLFEPYVSVGVGGHALNDDVVESTAMGGSLRLGAGLDIRLENIAISTQYMYSSYGFFEGSNVYENNELAAATETLGVGLKFYF